MNTSDTIEITEGSTIDTKAQTSKGLNNNILIFLLGTVLMNSLGMTIVSPVLPFMVRQYVGTTNLAAVVGWLSSTYAICQFLAAPGLGRLSDRYGRRPLLLFCLLGSAAGYILFGLGGALWVLFLGRIIDGLTGGNFSILAAYMTDVTEPKERGRLFGLFGATSGVGFLIGPVIGGFIANFGYAVPFYLSAGITLINCVWGYFNLPESLKAEHRVERIHVKELNPFGQLLNAFTLKNVRWFLLLVFLYAFTIATLQSNMGVLIIDSLKWSPENIGLIFLIIGAMDILVQGVLMRYLQPLLGEKTLVVGGLIGVGLAFLCMSILAFIASPVWIVAGAGLFAFSSGLVEPALRSLTSEAAEPRQQGIVQGCSQSMQSLSFIVGPFIVGELYTQAGHATPYWAVVGVAVAAIIVTLIATASMKKQASVTEVAESTG